MLKLGILNKQSPESILARNKTVSESYSLVRLQSISELGIHMLLESINHDVDYL